MPKPTIQLADLRNLKTMCEDCGRRRVWNRDRVAREQIRRGLKYPEDLLAHFVCDLCRSRGESGRNITASWDLSDRTGPGTYPDRRPLSEIDSVAAICGDCGDRNDFDRAKLDSVSKEAATVADLWRQAFCGICQAQGSDEPNVALYPEPPLPVAGKPAPRTDWSKADIFTEDRSDPFPTLPRRSRFVAEPIAEGA